MLGSESMQKGFQMGSILWLVKVMAMLEAQAQGEAPFGSESSGGAGLSCINFDSVYA